jgi:excisionase family DNA binding protein
MTEPTLTIKELAKYLNVTERTIYNLLERGELPGFKVGANWRFRKEDIDKWIEQNMIKKGKKFLKSVKNSKEKSDQ